MSWLFLFLFTLASPASAEDSLAWNPSVDLPIVLGTGTLWGALYTLVEDDLAPRGQVSDPKGLDALVKPGLDETAALASDVVLYGTIGVGLLAGSLSGGREVSAMGTRAGIMTEVFTVNALVTEWIKLSIRRPRPYTALNPDETEGLDEKLTEIDSEMSFPSGHASHVAAMALGAARTFDLSGASPAQKKSTYAAAALLGASAAALRVRAGVHHPTDVLGGLALGASIGWLVPTLHQRQEAPQLALSGRSFQVQGRW
jgi:membrane-associated phospholipid phosphatase